MKAVIQRVSGAQVSVDGVVRGRVGNGFLVLLGVCPEDTETVAGKLADKIAKMRIFEDENGKMNRCITDIDGEALVISQFTLAADCRKGNRPSFIASAKPDTAQALYEYFSRCLRQNGVRKVENGVFAADMQVEIHNDGPVTIWLDSDIYKQSRR